MVAAWPRTVCDWVAGTCADMRADMLSTRSRIATNLLLGEHEHGQEGGDTDERHDNEDDLLADGHRQILVWLHETTAPLACLGVQANPLTLCRRHRRAATGTRTPLGHGTRTLPPARCDLALGTQCLELGALSSGLILCKPGGTLGPQLLELGAFLVGER